MEGRSIRTMLPASAASQLESSTSWSLKTSHISTSHLAWGLGSHFPKAALNATSPAFTAAGHCKLCLAFPSAHVRGKGKSWVEK